MSMVPDSDRPAPPRGGSSTAQRVKADDIRDEEIEDLQRRVSDLRRRVEDLERRPVYVPMPGYPVDCPKWPPSRAYPYHDVWF